MLNGLWGRKVGMTQVFADNHRVIPVTVVDVSNWFVTQVKTADRDGYKAVQVGCVRARHRGKPFSSEWLQKLKQHFGAVCEARVVDESATMPTAGQVLETTSILAEGDDIDVIGVTSGKGFQGVIKRHGHSGGRGSHGDKLGRGPGSLTGLRTSGRVPKGRKLPGHMGVRQQTVRNLKVVRIDAEKQIVFVKGSVPGKVNSLVFMRKCR